MRLLRNNNNRRRVNPRRLSLALNLVNQSLVYILALLDILVFQSLDLLVFPPPRYDDLRKRHIRSPTFHSPATNSTNPLSNL